jgi:predicted DNA-binding transcriptional regulator AlpA
MSSEIVLRGGNKVVLMTGDGRMDVTNAARYIGFCRSYMYKMMKAGTAPKSVTVMDRTFFYKSDLDEWKSLNIIAN